MSTEVAVVWTTFSNPDVGKRLTEGLLEQQLAACVQTLPIHSAYRWKGAIQQETETLMLIKIRRSSYPRVEAFIRDIHDYEVPEIVMMPISAGLPAYLKWMGEETK